MGDAIMTNIPVKTGRSVDQWVATVRAHPPAPRRQLVEWLKRDHGLGHIQAEVLLGHIDRLDGFVDPTPEEMFAAQYGGAKACLRPIYDRLAELATSFGDDVV